jgi:predicted Zn-dependent peptidase
MPFNRHTTFISLILATLLLWGCPSNKQPKPFLSSDLTSVARFEFSGISVIQVQQARLHMQVDFLFGNLDRNGQGAEQILMKGLAQAGTSQKSPHEFARSLENAGGRLEALVAADFSGLRLKCMPEDLKNCFQLIGDLLLNPKLNPRYTIELLEEWDQSKSTAKMDPTFWADSLQGLLWLEASTATVDPSPSADDRIPTFTQLEEMLTGPLLSRCNMALVVSGPLDVESIGDLIVGSLDMLPEGDCPPQSPKSLKTGVVEVLHKPEGDGAICATWLAPSSNLPDAFVADAIAKMLEIKLQDLLVKKLKLAHACRFQYIPKPAPHLRLDMMGPQMSQAAELAASELRKAKNLEMSATSLDSAKRWLGLVYQQELESSSNWATTVAKAHFHENWNMYGNPTERLKALLPSHVPYVLQKHCTGVSWVFVGDTTKLDKKSLLRL